MVGATVGVAVTIEEACKNKSSKDRFKKIIKEYINSDNNTNNKKR